MSLTGGEGFGATLQNIIDTAVSTAAKIIESKNVPAAQSYFYPSPAPQTTSSQTTQADLSNISGIIKIAAIVLGGLFLLRAVK